MQTVIAVLYSAITHVTSDWHAATNNRWTVVKPIIYAPNAMLFKLIYNDQLNVVETTAKTK